jgi:hypothetical protein
MLLFVRDGLPQGERLRSIPAPRLVCIAHRDLLHQHETEVIDSRRLPTPARLDWHRNRRYSVGNSIDFASNQGNACDRGLAEKVHKFAIRRSRIGWIRGSRHEPQPRAFAPSTGKTALTGPRRPGTLGGLPIQGQVRDDRDHDAKPSAQFSGRSKIQELRFV